MHFANLPVISVMTRSRGKTLNTDSKEEGGDKDRRDHDAVVCLEIVGVTESLYQLTDTDSEEEREPSQHRDIGSRARDWPVVTRYHRCCLCSVNARQSDDGETNL